MVKWNSAGTKYLAANSNFPSGLRAGLNGGLTQWNRSGSALRYASPTYTGGWQIYAFRASYGYTSLLGTAPGVAATQRSGSSHSGGTLYLSNRYSWVNGSQNIPAGKADVQTVVVHEVGHFLLNGGQSMTGMGHLRARSRISVMVAALALGITACSQTPESTDSQKNRGASKSERVIEAHAYEVDSHPAAAVSFPLNENVFEGRVESLRPDVHAVDKLEDGSVFEVVYTPVVIRVTAVHKGSLKPGAEVVVRSMGGSADGVKYVTEQAPAKNTFAKGTSLFVFGSVREAVDSEKVPAITPHFVYQESGATLVDATYANGSSAAHVSKGELRAQVRTPKAGS